VKRRTRATARTRVRESVPPYAASTSPDTTRLLLDTQVWLWWRADDRRLGRVTRAAIRAAGEVRFSVASAWEIAIKAGLGKLETPPLEGIRVQLEQHGFKPLAIEIEHALDVAALAKVHRDPFDRLLAAQASAEGLTLVTADPIFAKYGVPVLSARD